MVLLCLISWIKSVKFSVQVSDISSLDLLICWRGRVPDTGSRMITVLTDRLLGWYCPALPPTVKLLILYNGVVHHTEPVWSAGAGLVL